MKKPRRWPWVVLILVVLLGLLFAAGAAAANRSSTGGGVPLELVTLLLAPAISAVIIALVARARRPRVPRSFSWHGGVQFVVFPFEPFLTGVARIRWQQGDSTPVEPMAQTMRPVVVTDGESLTIWAAPEDPLPMLSVPADAVQSVRAGTVSAQLSRIPITDTVRVILVEVVIRRELLDLPLPICDAASISQPATARVIDSTVAWMQTALHGLPVEEENEPG
jgi:hypothetical protein